MSQLFFNNNGYHGAHGAAGYHGSNGTYSGASGSRGGDGADGQRGGDAGSIDVYLAAINNESTIQVRAVLGRRQGFSGSDTK